MRYKLPTLAVYSFKGHEKKSDFFMTQNFKYMYYGTNSILNSTYDFVNKKKYKPRNE